MIKQQVVVTQKNGIHARPAAEIVQICQKFEGKVTLCKGCNKADGCSILQVMLLGAENGSTVEIEVNGNNEANALARIIDVFEGGAGI